MKTHQFERVDKLLSYIDEHFKQDIRAQQIEQICHYSYRNMNRVFQSFQGETIGKHIQRRRIEKAAEYLSYSSQPISVISDDVGFSDVAAFSKAFKLYFCCSPSQFRDKKSTVFSRSVEGTTALQSEYSLTHSLETLPSFDYVYLEYRGDYTDEVAIDRLWERFLALSDELKLIDDNSIVFGSILDDDEISASQFCRYRSCLIVEKTIQSGGLSYATHSQQRYARFIYDRARLQSEQVYQQIYSQWQQTVKQEFADKPTLEFYHDLESRQSNALTEIHIPIV